MESPLNAVLGAKRKNGCGRIVAMTDTNEWLLVWCHVSIIKLGGGERGRGRNFDISAEASLGNLKFLTKKNLIFLISVTKSSRK